MSVSSKKSLGIVITREGEGGAKQMQAQRKPDQRDKSFSAKRSPAKRSTASSHQTSSEFELSTTSR
jgi:hypothetical protein